MKKMFFLAAASALALATAANAGDLYRPAAAPGSIETPYAGVNWSGFYFGVNGGYGWGAGGSAHAEWDVTSSPPLSAGDTKSFLTEGGFGGGQMGYNWQQRSWVYGVEADIQGANLTGVSDQAWAFDPAAPLSSTALARSNLNWFGTVRGRLGVNVLDGKGLVYATGGFAYGSVQEKLDFTYKQSPVIVGSSASSAEIATGYTVGGGFEYMFSPRWSLKAEYQYMDLGARNLRAGYSFAPCAGCAVNSAGEAKFNHQYDTVRAGLNYHVGGGYEPLK
jgi:outer membrane immunogenic protein